MKKGEKVSTFLNRFDKIVDDLKAIEEMKLWLEYEIRSAFFNSIVDAFS